MNTKTTFMFRILVLLSIAPVWLACSSERAPETANGTPAVGGADPADGGARGDSLPSEGGSFAGGASAGGDAGAKPNASGVAHDDDVGAAAGGAGGENADDAGGEPGAGAGGEPPKPLYLNGGFAYVDRTDEGASRTIVWDDALIFDPARCMRVGVGQTVTFAGDHGNHPLVPKGGDTPNPVGPTATFSTPGIFGYECIPHPSEMNGAIEVVP